MESDISGITNCCKTFISSIKMIIIGGKFMEETKTYSWKQTIDGQFTYLRDVLRVR